MPQNFLDELLGSTRTRVAEAAKVLTDDVLEQRIAAQEEPRGFHRSLAGPEVSFIAEVKRATPSKGRLTESFDVGKLAEAYAAGGAAAISVLTEPEHFLGSLDDLVTARRVGLPVLRKDFVLDPLQVLEARAAGADAVLLIARIIEGPLDSLVSLVHSLGMDALVEVFDEAEVGRALDAGAALVGINHRDLGTFEVDPHRTAKLAPMIPDGVTIVALSGVSARSEVLDLREAGAHAVLVGEALVTAHDPAAKLRELRGA